METFSSATKSVPEGSRNFQDTACAGAFSVKDLIKSLQVFFRESVLWEEANFFLYLSAVVHGRSSCRAGGWQPKTILERPCNHLHDLMHGVISLSNE